MKKRIELIMRVSEQAGSEKFYQKSESLGTLAALSFKEEHGRERQQRHRSQMTGLENIAETTLKVTDILDYIKKQTARQKGWQKEFGANHERFGETLKNYIETGLTPFINEVCRQLQTNSATDEGKKERQEVHLHLIRQLIRQLVVHYEYQASQP